MRPIDARSVPYHDCCSSVRYAGCMPCHCRLAFVISPRRRFGFRYWETCPPRLRVPDSESGHRNLANGSMAAVRCTVRWGRAATAHRQGDAARVAPGLRTSDTRTGHRCECDPKIRATPNKARDEGCVLPNAAARMLLRGAGTDRHRQERASGDRNDFGPRETRPDMEKQAPSPYGQRWYYGGWYFL